MTETEPGTPAERARIERERGRRQPAMCRSHLPRGEELPVTHLTLGADPEEPSVRLHDDPAVHVRTVEGETGNGHQGGECVRPRMPVVVPATDRDDGDLGPQNPQLLGEPGILRPVVRNLEDLDIPQREVRCRVGLGIGRQEHVGLAVGGDEDSPTGGRRPQD